MKPGVLCLLLLPACGPTVTYVPPNAEYELTWFCISPEGCEHAEELERIDRASQRDFDYYFTSTQDESFSDEGYGLEADTLPLGCYWMYYLSFLGHELEPSKFCYNPAGFELELSIPNEDPATHSKWVVSARDERFL